MNRIIVFAPHPDDETLSCGGTIALNIRKGNDVRIIFMTDGRYSHQHTLGIDTYPTPQDVKKIRSEEAKEVTGVLGVKPQNLTFLDYEDGTLRNSVEDASNRVRELLEKIQPDSIYFPARTDKHRDHKATNIIVKNAICALAKQPVLFQYVVWKSGLASKHTITVDISEVLPIKKLAISEYKSQVTIFSEKQKRPILIKRFLNNFMVAEEVFIAARFR